MNELAKIKPLKVGDVVIVPGMSGCNPPFKAEISFISAGQDWCLLIDEIGAESSIQMSRANELERVSK